MNLINASVGKALFPSILWETHRPAIHLTFDDGPHPLATPKALDILKNRGMKATFFLIGKNVQQYPDIVLQILGDGHTIGNHTYNHPSMFFRSKNFQVEEIQKTSDSIQKITGKAPEFFRPPYGYFDYTTLKAAKSSQQQVVLWSIDSLDFKNLPNETIAPKVVSKAKAGSILLFHDNHLTESKITSLVPMVIDGLIQRGFHFEPLSSSCLN
ncbi:MAG: polysaccharide deacetylase family protein [Ignavibacteriales bacterium]|nr:polysaccharide deacetylase family protein [Ignavibacteriales bacterium]